MGVSRVRVGDSRVRDRGRGQGVPPSPTNTGGTKTNKHALPPFLLLREKKTTLPPFCFEEQKTQNIAAMKKTTLPPFCRHFAVGEQRLIKHSIA